MLHAPVRAAVPQAARSAPAAATPVREPGAAARARIATWLQQAVGNQAVLRSRGNLPPDGALLRSSRAIAAGRIEVGAGGAAAERAADTAAARALRGERAIEGGQVVARALPAELGGPGRPLDESVRAQLAPGFGPGLAAIRVHDDAAAARASHELGARAWSYGEHIGFARGAYAPGAPEGRRLLAHEVAHALAPGAGPVLRRQLDRDRDYDAEVKQLKTSDIERDLQQVRDRIAELTESGPESEQLERRRAALERALVTRDQTRVVFQRRVQAERAANQTGNAVATAGLLALRHGRIPSIFAEGVSAGFLSEVPTAAAGDFVKQLAEHPDEFYLGYLKGLPVGIWHGGVNLVEGIGSLIVMLLKATLAASPAYQMAEFARDPEGYRARRRQELERLVAVAMALKQFAGELAADPTIVVKMSADLGFLLGEGLAQWFADFAAKGPEAQGEIAGDVVGQIVFEILLEVLLAVATEGIGNLLRGVAAAGQGVRHGGRFANALRRTLEASPALRRVLETATRTEHAAEAARVTERGAEVTHLATDARRATSAGEKSVGVAGAVTGGERRLAGSADETAEALRRAETPTPATPPQPATPAKAAAEVAEEKKAITPELAKNIEHGIDLPDAPGKLELELEPTRMPDVNAPPASFSDDPRALLTLEEQNQLVQYHPDLNRRASHRSAVRFEPKPGGVYKFGPRSYTYDAQRNLIEATTTDLTLGVRDPVMYANIPGIRAGEDYGHLLGIDFGHIDAQLGRYGGVRQTASVNRPLGQTPALWYQAERAALDEALQLKRANKPLRVVARAEGYVKGVPARTRIFVESGSSVVYDSGWIVNPVVP